MRRGTCRRRSTQSSNLPSEDEWVAGIEYEVLPNTRVSLAYTHRNIVRWVEDVSRRMATLHREPR